MSLFESPERVRSLVAAGFGGGRVLVVGDLMLDRYLWGGMTRISPEAPVPVLRLERQTETPGGGANVARNLVRLGAKVRLAGAVGADRDGETLRTLLDKDGIDTAALVVAADRPTTTKTRVIARHQQVLRIDHEDTAGLQDQPPGGADADDPRPPGAERRGDRSALREAVLALIGPNTDLLLLSDYAKGVLDAESCAEFIRAARQRGIPVLVDPKGEDYRRYTGATLLSPNRAELALALGLDPRHPELLDHGEALRRELGIEYLVVTEGERGMTLLRDGARRRVGAMAKEVYDVSGAGDTVIAVIAAALGGGLCILDAVHLANLAAGVVVGKVGTVPVDRSQLLAAMDTESALAQSAKVQTLPDLLPRVEQWRARGERIVFTNGCFDLLHAGHVIYLEKARAEGKRLIVGLNTDRSVRALKGPSRPLIGEGDRARVLAALAAVDAVVLFDDATPLRLIEALQPDVLVKGADYKESEVVGAVQVRARGGEVVLIPLVQGRSSSAIVDAAAGKG